MIKLFLKKIGRDLLKPIKISFTSFLVRIQDVAQSQIISKVGKCIKYLLMTLKEYLLGHLQKEKIYIIDLISLIINLNRTEI